MLALVECVRTGGYHAEKGRFTTYITPFLDGAMRRHLECSMGTLALDRDSMSLVRKVQSLYHRDGKEIGEICELLGVSYHAAARAIAYPTHFSLSMTCKARKMTEMSLSGLRQASYPDQQKTL